MANAANKYRPDIDGLRAIAIIPVLLFHLQIRQIRGGFVGVDIFFVISGYLITLHIFSELQAGKFSLSSFYERRIRRIFPALVGMFLGTTVLAYLLLFPTEIVNYAKSLIAAALSVSNFYFWANSGYFTGGEKPLLHTWSLAVEEQYYLTLPLTLMLLQRYWPRRLRSVIAAIAIVAFAISALTVTKYPNATFYLLPARAWELLVGSLLALNVLRLPVSPRVRQVSAALGLAMIGYAVLRYSPALPFPGPTALLPCFGAALIIASGGGENPTLVERLLSTRPFTAIGLISYSLYLWHYPIIYFLKSSTSIVFGRVVARLLPFVSQPRAVLLELQISVLVASFACATLSWWFVERPFRTGPRRPSRAAIFRFGAVSSAALIAIGIAITALHGLPGRFSPRAIRVASYALSSNPGHYRQGTCFMTPTDPPYDKDNCLRLSDVKENWLLMGDSHAAHLYYGLASTYPEVNLMQVTASGCEAMSERVRGEIKDCGALFQYMYGEFLPHHRVDRVILAGNWHADDVDRIGKSVQALKAMGQSPVVIGPIMQYDTALPRLLAASIESGNPSLAQDHRVHFYDSLDAKMKDLAASSWQVPYFSYKSAFCNGDRCLEWSGPDVPLQWDDDHLLDSGSVLVAQRIEQEKILTP